ncbi:MAG: hypothetical protein INQ03_12000 [Candidatus Heimdallarchaeota archaeon]|nr:hypothetical protein [Candidatus Heimdallarchaeota archaeon]
MADVLILNGAFLDFLKLLGFLILFLIALRFITKAKLLYSSILMLSLASIFSVASLYVVDFLAPETTNAYFFNFILVNGIIIAILAYNIQRNIITPIQKIDRKTREMAGGDLTSYERHNIKGTGETQTLQYTTNDLAKQFRVMIANIMNSANELGRAAETMASGSEQVAATTSEISTTISSIAENAQLQVRALDEVSRILSDMVTVIDDSMREIGITSRITLDIAEQTNLVALNASIEAAKAGTHGEGFTVVADHVRQLSIESKNAASTVNGIIKNITGRIRESVSSIVDAVERVASVAENTAASSEEAAAATQEQSASLQEMNNQAQRLAVLTNKTERDISEFKV